jgi:hypothetical protein
MNKNNKIGGIKMRDFTIVKYNGELGKILVDDENKFRFLPENQGGYYLSSLEIVTKEDVLETTDEEKIEYLKRRFIWGEILETYHIEEYIIFKYTDKNRGGNILFHTFINFKSTGISYDSLDSALIGLIAYKHEGANSRAGEYFEKMLNII